MGTFMGHFLPGFFFIAAAVWWTLNIFRAHFRSRCKNGAAFRNQPWYAGPFWQPYPMESVVKIVTVTIGITGELITAFEDGHFEHIGNAQHMTMYFFFGMNGLVDLLVYHGVPLPGGSEAVTGILAYSVEGFLFFNHLHGRPPMDVQLHMFLFYAIAMCAISILFEIRYRDYVMPSLSRAFFTMMQGTWFIQVGFILYPPFAGMQPWLMDNHEQMMITTLIFTWHLGVNLVLMATLGGFVWLYMKVRGQLEQEVRYHSLNVNAFASSNDGLLTPANGKANGKANGGSHLDLIESDSDGV